MGLEMHFTGDNPDFKFCHCINVCYLHMQRASIYSLKLNCRVATLGIMAKTRACSQCKQWLDDVICAIFAYDQAGVACLHKNRHTSYPAVHENVIAV